MRPLERLPRTLVDSPEANVLFFAFLVNDPWEFLQVPLFAGLAEAPHWHGVRFCTGAAVGDAVLILAIYSLVATLARDRRWVLHPRVWALTLFVGTVRAPRDR